MHPAKQVQITKWRLRVTPGHLAEHSRFVHRPAATTHHVLRSKVVDRRLKRRLDLAQQVYETVQQQVGVGAGKVVWLGLEKADGQLRRPRRVVVAVAGRVRRRL